MLINHTKKHPSPKNQPKSYTLGKGHINFFKDKLLYLKKRHKIIKKEMSARGFKSSQTISLNTFKKESRKDFKPNSQDKQIIKKRIKEKLKQKPDYYRYYSKKKPLSFLIKLTNNAN